MDKNTAVADFLGEFSNEKEVNPFEDNLKDPFQQQEVVEEAVVPEEVKEEKPLPFNKDPKVQRFIEKEVSKRLADFKPEVPEPKAEVHDDDYYVRLIGNDTPEKVAMIREARARDERMLDMAEERAFNRLSQHEQESLQADQEAEQELENAFENIEETYDVDISSNSPLAKKTRQEFVSFVERIAPKDRNGDIVDYPDMASAWETFSEIKKATTQPSRAKELANRGMARSSEAPVATQTKRVDWNSVDDMMDSLK